MTKIIMKLPFAVEILVVTKVYTQQNNMHSEHTVAILINNWKKWFIHYAATGTNQPRSTSGLYIHTAVTFRECYRMVDILPSYDITQQVKKLKIYFSSFLVMLCRFRCPLKTRHHPGNKVIIILLEDFSNSVIQSYWQN